MKQMENSSAPIIARMGFGRLSSAFFKRSCEGDKVFFVGPSGNMHFVFPVLEEGSISRHGKGDDQPYPSEDVAVLDPKDLGIAEVKWAVA